MKVLICLSNGMSKRRDYIIKVLKGVLKGVLKVTGMTPQQINHGHCRVFAQSVLDASDLDDLEIANVQTFKRGGLFDRNVLSSKWNIHPPKGIKWDDLDQIDFKSHAWVADPVEGLHYDAEAPQGVKSFFELPFNRRLIKEYLHHKRHLNS